MYVIVNVELDHDYCQGVNYVSWHKTEEDAEAYLQNVRNQQMDWNRRFIVYEEQMFAKMFPDVDPKGIGSFTKIIEMRNSPWYNPPKPPYHHGSDLHIIEVPYRACRDYMAHHS